MAYVIHISAQTRIIYTDLHENCDWWYVLSYRMKVTDWRHAFYTAWRSQTEGMNYHAEWRSQTDGLFLRTT